MSFFAQKKTQYKRRQYAFKLEHKINNEYIKSEKRTKNGRIQKAFHLENKEKGNVFVSFYIERQKNLEIDIQE